MMCAPRLLRAVLAAALALVWIGAMPSRLAAQSSVNVTGKWLFQVETAAGSGTPTITFKQVGEKLTGRYSGQLGENDVTGTVKGRAITFSFGGSAEGTQIEVVYSGTVESETSMKGTVDLGGLAGGTFTAKRQ